MKLYLPVIFALGTALAWGVYGPTLGNARSHDKPPLWTGFKPYLGIGFAYLVVAIIGGSIAMKLAGDNFSFSGEQTHPVKWGFYAGLLGAIGALCLTGALVMAKGNSTLVMPVVFGGAVSVNALVSAWLYRDKATPSVWMWVGIVGVVASVCLVAANIPHPKKPAKPATEPATVTATDASSTG